MGIEQLWARRSFGGKILLASLAVGAIGVGPLLLYAVFGPADGNPIGLGLLAVLAAPAAAIGAGIGLVVMLIERISRGRG